VDREPTDRSARRRPAHRRRARGGGVERAYLAGLAAPIAALIVALVGLHAPSGLQGQPTAPPTFDPAPAVALAHTIAGFPDRTPGTVTATLATAAVHDAFVSAGVTPRTDTFAGRRRDGTPAQLVNLVAVLPGSSRQAIVVMAHRDDIPPGPGLVDSAVGTATVVGLAAAFAHQTHARTLVFASVDGGVSGALGARRLLSRFPAGLRPFAVLDVEGIAGPGRALPVADLGDGRDRTQAGLPTMLEELVGGVPGGGHVVRTELGQQFLDLVFPPSAPGGQAPYVDRAVPAIRIGTDAGVPGVTRISPALLAANAQAVNELVLALDVGAAPDGPQGPYLQVGGRVVSGWVVSLVAVALLVSPVLVALALGSAAGRGRSPMRPELLRWGRAAAAGAGLVAGVLAASAAGLLPRHPWTAPFPPVGSGVGWSAFLFAGAGLGAALLLLRVYAPPGDTPGREGATMAVVLAAGAGSAALATVAAPAIGLLLALSLHPWVALILPAARGRATRGALVWVGLALTLGGTVLLSGTGPADLVRMLGDGRIPPAAALGCVGVIAGAVLLTRNLVLRGATAGPSGLP
jgi:hypothetical protein